MDNRLTVLFVDDEPRLLEAVVRMLRPYRAEWNVLTAPSGSEALTILGKQPIDVVVSDMRMPGMNGAELLEKIAERHPGVVRFILSGQSDRESLLRSIGSTHQFLSKPCDSQHLRQAVDRAYALRRLLQVPKLSSLVSRIGGLPALPSLFIAIRRELQRDEPSLVNIGTLAAQDIGISAKLLQFANSGRFAGTHSVLKVEQAVQLLGIETVRSLVLASHLFDACPSERLPLNLLWQHSFQVATAARAIAESEQQNSLACECAFSAGLLHDCGLVLIATHLPEELQRIQAASANMDWLAAERQELGATHQELGAYLLGLWGLPDGLVEAVAFHHQPAAAPHPDGRALSAVHIAESVVISRHPGLSWEKGTNPEEAFVGADAIRERLKHWREVAGLALDHLGEPAA
jgi:HD-like signal output (HDOD) protein/CheY-like chemotaxis protein